MKTKFEHLVILYKQAQLTDIIDARAYAQDRAGNRAQNTSQQPQGPIFTGNKPNQAPGSPAFKHNGAPGTVTNVFTQQPAPQPPVPQPPATQQPAPQQPAPNPPKAQQPQQPVQQANYFADAQLTPTAGPANPVTQPQPASKQQPTPQPAPQRLSPQQPAAPTTIPPSVNPQPVAMSQTKPNLDFNNLPKKDPELEQLLNQNKRPQTSRAPTLREQEIARTANRQMPIQGYRPWRRVSEKVHKPFDGVAEEKYHGKINKYVNPLIAAPGAKAKPGQASWEDLPSTRMMKIMNGEIPVPYKRENGDYAVYSDKDIAGKGPMHQMSAASRSMWYNPYETNNQVKTLEDAERNLARWKAYGRGTQDLYNRVAARADARQQAAARRAAAAKPKPAPARAQPMRRQVTT